MAIQWLSAVLTSVGNTPFALALGFDGIETKLWLISQNFANKKGHSIE